MSDTKRMGDKSHSHLLVDSVGSRKGKEKTGGYKIPQLKAKLKVMQNVATCCGREPHARNSCLAKDICHTCKKQGHYNSQCFKKPSVADININTPNEQFQEYTMAHCSQTPLILDRRIYGISQSK